MQDVLQAALRAATGTAGQFVEDIQAYASLQAIPEGQAGERMLGLKPSAPDATQAFLDMLQNGIGTVTPIDPATLFSSGETGTWLEALDIANMWQLTTGATAVTAAGQPVGLILDKSKSRTLGSQVLVNSSFDSGAANWTVTGSDATHIVTFAGGTMNFFSGTTTPSLLVTQASVMTTNRVYRTTVDVSAVVSGSIKSDILAGLVFSNTLGTTNYTSVCSSLSFTFTRNTANVDVTWNSVETREIQGWHPRQATAAARPLYNGTAIIFDGIDDAMTIPFGTSPGANCTIAYSDAGNSPTILQGQTVAATYTLNQSFRKFLIVNRALTGAESASLAAWLVL